MASLEDISETIENRRLKAFQHIMRKAHSTREYYLTKARRYEIDAIEANVRIATYEMYGRDMWQAIILQKELLRRARQNRVKAMT